MGRSLYGGKDNCSKCRDQGLASCRCSKQTVKKSYDIKNLVLEGGGVSGSAYCGALETMHDFGLFDSIERVGGTSAGMITALLIAIGYSPSEITRIVRQTKFSSFQDDSFGVIRDSYRFIKHYGWHKGDSFKKWIKKHIQNKLGYADVTFRELSYLAGKGEANAKHLYAVGTNLTKQRVEIYSRNTTPDMLIADAARISMSIPFFFQCVRNKDGDILVDGGVANNFPIRLFDKNRFIPSMDSSHFNNPEGFIINPQTLGFKLDTKTEIDIANLGIDANVKIDSIQDYTKAIVTYLMDQANTKHLTSADLNRTVLIDRAGIKATDFDLTDEDTEKLMSNGRIAVEKHFGAEFM